MEWSWVTEPGALTRVTATSVSCGLTVTVVEFWCWGPVVGQVWLATKLCAPVEPDVQAKVTVALGPRRARRRCACDGHAVGRVPQVDVEAGSDILVAEFSRSR